MSLHAGLTQADLALLAFTRNHRRPAFELDGETWTYAQAADRTFRGARALIALGLSLGEGVAVLSANRPEVFCAATGAILVGARYTPLNPYASLADHAFVLTDAGVRILLYDPAFRDRAVELGEHCPELRPLPLFGERGSLEGLGAEQSNAPLITRRDPEDIAVLAYTGGTTGQPKGVMLSHRAVVTNIVTALAEWQLPHSIRLLLASPLSHAAGALVLPTLLCGGTVYLHRKFDPARVLDTVQSERLTTLLGVPTMIYALLDELGHKSRDVSSLETFIYGSAPMNPARLQEALDRFGPVLMQHYAQTEAPMTLTMLRKEDHDLSRPHLLRSCGQPTLGARIALLGDDDVPVPTGQAAEICACGPLVMSGYWNRPRETQEALRGGWLRTGDIAHQDEEGYLYIVDRKKDVIITGGFNVYPREVEDVLCAHPAVAEAAIIGVPHDHWGEQVCAVIMRRSGSDVAAEELMNWVRDRKGAVQAPKQIEFVDRMPLTPVGKIDKAALRAPHWKGASRSVN